MTNRWFYALGLALGAFVLQAVYNRQTQKDCRCFPGESCWPSPSEWADFNETVGGRLIATVPIAAACHHSSLAPYDAEACEALRSTWWFPETHVDSSSSAMAPWFANASCDPFTEPDAQCVIGSYVQYSVKAAGVADYQATIAFAASKNIRLIIRNTGHDYHGKSTGAGAIALWTHFLRDTEVVNNYQSPFYNGPAMKVGAGVMNREAYEAADAAGLVVVGGVCPTVGLAGGLTQGGGHGPLNSRFGLASDQVLEWEVVTAEGKHLVASPTDNSDLYWALSGGGGGTFAAVVSMTVRAHRLRTVSAARLAFTAANVSPELYNKAIHLFLQSLPGLAEVGSWSTWLMGTGFFMLQPLIGPDIDVAEVQSRLQPTLSFLDENEIPYDYHIQQFDTLLESYDTMFPPSNVTNFNVGGRLIPRSLLDTPEAAETLLDAMNFITNEGAIISGNTLNVSKFPSGVENSINPVWRSAVLNMVVGLLYNADSPEANLELQKKMTHIIGARLEALTPGGGAYLNEADFRQPGWQNVFYGRNYASLREIKAKYDPASLFYGVTAVGSEDWAEQEDGSLCRASK